MKNIHRAFSLIFLALALLPVAASAQAVANEYYFTKRNASNTANQQVKVTPTDGRVLGFGSLLEPIAVDIGNVAKLAAISALDTPNSLLALDGDGNPYALETSDLELRFRQGSDAERQTVIFASGEPVWTTDTKELYVGDGETLGGVAPRVRELHGETGSGFEPVVQWRFEDTQGRLLIFNTADGGMGELRFSENRALLAPNIFGGRIVCYAPYDTNEANIIAEEVTGSKSFSLPDADGTLGVRVSVPESATAAGVVGTWAADNSYLYICTAANTWRRVALSSW